MFERIRRFFDTNRYHNAVKRADAAFQRTGSRQYIILQTDFKLVVMDRAYFRLMKQEKRLPPEVTINTLQRECLYHTPYANGTEAMSNEEMNKRLDKYLRWCKAVREHEKAVKRQRKLAKK